MKIAQNVAVNMMTLILIINVVVNAVGMLKKRNMFRVYADTRMRMITLVAMPIF